MCDTRVLSENRFPPAPHQDVHVPFGVSFDGLVKGVSRCGHRGSRAPLQRVRSLWGNNFEAPASHDACLSSLGGCCAFLTSSRLYHSALL
jgi:hypothetical protein